MRDVRRVVHRQPYGYRQQYGGRGVYGQTPEVHEPAHVDQGEEDVQDDDEAGVEVGQEEEGGREDAAEGQGKVAEENRDKGVLWYKVN